MANYKHSIRRHCVTTLKGKRQGRRRIIQYGDQVFLDAKNRLSPGVGFDWGIESATTKRVALINVLMPVVWGKENVSQDFVNAMANQFALRLPPEFEMTKEQLDWEFELVASSTGRQFLLGKEYVFSGSAN